MVIRMRRETPSFFPLGTRIPRVTACTITFNHKGKTRTALPQSWEGERPFFPTPRGINAIEMHSTSHIRYFRKG